MEAQPKEIQRYSQPDGRVPFDEWFSSLRDANAKVKIDTRLDRLQEGNVGDSRSVGEGVCELRINYGPGYRVYFGQVGSTIVLLLVGGDKSTQDRDIRKAKQYWTNYRS
ncbi:MULTISPECIES: type II toxin-antitoxin system RelE/ParE family toxin [unclassified Microcoleus]|uniref:type II toxin-antitoxin system RelE/ParE family toxin n=1 Tax=unclassified Microcoleus TaxID=2642155 RepID=UPI002FD2B574